MSLSERQAAVLAHAELEGGYYKTAGLIRQNLGVSQWQYAAELSAVIDTAEAQEAQPALCRRLRTLREKRRAVRSTRRTAAGRG